MIFLFHVEINCKWT